MASSSVLDMNLCEQLSTNVEKLTTSGNSELDQELLKKVKAACKKSDEYVKHVYHLLMHQLEEDHAEIRLATVLVCDELFRRSHQFRELLVNDFQTFMELTVGCDGEQELPPPLAVAAKLKRKTLNCIGQWYNKYGEGYKKLSLGYHFLKDCKQVDFSDINARSLAQIAEENEAKKRQEIINNEKLSKLQLEMKELLPEINSCMEQMRACFKLLRHSDVFDEVDFSEPQPCCSKDLSPEDLKTDQIDELMRLHGLGSSKYSLTVQVEQDKQPLKVTNDNRAVIQTLQEHKNLVVVRYQPTVHKWIQIAIKCSTSSEELKVAIDTKNALEEVIKKYKEVGLGDQRISEEPVSSSSEDEDEFEEVATKEGYEPTIPVHHRKLYGLPALPSVDTSGTHKVTSKEWKLVNEEETERQDPTSFSYNANRMETAARKKGLLEALHDKLDTKPSVSPQLDPSKQELYARAPKIRVVHLGGIEMDQAAVTLKQEMGHRFWTSSQANTSQEKSVNQRLGRVIEIGNNLKAVEWKCRAPLPSGKLCPRQDRFKCPLHGKIIPRDEIGNPSREEDRRLLETLKEKHQQENPEWQDPTLLKELQAVTGIDLTIKKRGKKDKNSMSSKKKKYPHLTDVKKSKSTARSRLQKKVFADASVKRVAKVLDSMDHKKYDDKFGNQFNYAWQS